MVEPAEFLDACHVNGVEFFVGVPDSLLQPLCTQLLVAHPKEKHVIAANEGNAIALATGYYLATGSISCVYMQNSGLGNAINPLTSLVDTDVYSIPMLLLIGWRGEMFDGKQLADEPQHVKQGRITLELLECLEIPFYLMHAGISHVGEIVRAAAERARAEGRAVALVARRGTFSASELRTPLSHRYGLTREDALKALVSSIPGDAVVVSTTGKVSRELFEIRVTEAQGSEKDFLSIGAMGHALQIAAGIALARPGTMVVCVDGDGALIMHMGGLATSATMPNLLHVVMNNGTHESVGGQPTRAFEIDIKAVALACGYGSGQCVTGVEELRRAVKSATTMRCSALIEVRIASGSRENLGRPTQSPKAAKRSFMRFMKVPNISSE
jgi:phosphonopyruvate decarboxylase